MGTFPWQAYVIVGVFLAMLACAVGMCLKRAWEVEEGWVRKMLFAAAVANAFVMPITLVIEVGLWSDRLNQLRAVEQAARLGAKTDEDPGRGYTEVRVWGQNGLLTEYRIQTVGAILWRGLTIQLVGSGTIFFPSWIVLRVVKVRQIRSSGFDVLAGVEASRS